MIIVYATRGEHGVIPSMMMIEHEWRSRGAPETYTTAQNHRPSPNNPIFDACYTYRMYFFNRNKHMVQALFLARKAGAKSIRRIAHKYSFPSLRNGISLLEGGGCIIAPALGNINFPPVFHAGKRACTTHVLGKIIKITPTPLSSKIIPEPPSPRRSSLIIISARAHRDNPPSKSNQPRLAVIYMRISVAAAAQIGPLEAPEWPNVTLYRSISLSLSLLSAAACASHAHSNTHLLGRMSWRVRMPASRRSRGRAHTPLAADCRPLPFSLARARPRAICSCPRTLARPGSLLFIIEYSTTGGGCR